MSIFTQALMSRPCCAKSRSVVQATQKFSLEQMVPLAQLEDVQGIRNDIDALKNIGSAQSLVSIASSIMYTFR